ncbi:MAG: UTRA domain-containing protein [Chromatiales bacterium]|nr:UTRA domain-containing protein [Chromatiales bacterium]
MPATHSWQSIRHEVLRRISERIWPPGALIPSEHELAREFGCARATVNRALRELADGGLLDRRRKAGTRVAIAPVRKARLDINVIRFDVERRGATYRHSLIERRRTSPTEPVRSRLRLDHVADMLYLRALHLADEHPCIYEERWVHLAAAPEMLEVDLDSISANEWLVRNLPFSSGDIAFSAANANAREAELLETVEGQALFVVERTTWQGECPITSVRMLHAPGFRMRMTL